MSSHSNLRKQLRRKKLLDFLEKANRDSMSVHNEKLNVLRQAATDLDNGWRDGQDIRFLDMQTAYRLHLEPQIRDLAIKLESDVRRATVLNRRVEACLSKVRLLKANIIQASELDQLLDRISGKNKIAMSVSHKCNGQE